MEKEKRLIDANALKAVIKKEECDCEVFPWAVDNAPTVDAVEVVRCKDCRNNGQCSIQEAMTEAPRTGIRDCFCSCGESSCRKPK